MINGTLITIVGNLGNDPELRFTPSGSPVATMTVAVPQRRYDRQAGKWEDTGTTWFKVNAWRYLAEHAAESLQRGMRVIVVGSLTSRPWEDNDGNKRESWEITADAIGPDLSFATASVKRVRRDEASLPDDPWADDNGASASTAASTTAAKPGNGGSRGRKTASVKAGTGTR